MEIRPTAIRDVVILEPRVFRDSRGFFMETFNEKEMRSLGLPHHFAQDNCSMSVQNVVRGLHYQIKQPQGKLIRVTEGKIFDVAVDLRRSSTTFGQHISVVLSSEEPRMLWIPEGFAHGFAVLSASANLAYKTTDFWAPEFERTVVWNDPSLGIDWPVRANEAIVSGKDQAGKPFAEAECFD